jgi:hypothetical protein
MRVASAALDESVDWIGRRLQTYDEQDGEADAHRRVIDAARLLKARLAAHVLDGSTNKPG